MANQQRGFSHRESQRIAFCGLTAALSSVLMFLGSAISLASYCTPILGSVLLLPILFEYGKRSALLTYLTVSVLCLFFSFDRESALFYLLYAYYPIIKWQIDRIHPRPLRFLVRLLYFNASLCVLHLILTRILHIVPYFAFTTAAECLLTVLFVFLFNVCLFLFDRLLWSLCFLYPAKIQPKLRFFFK